MSPGGPLPWLDQDLLLSLTEALLALTAALILGVILAQLLADTACLSARKPADRRQHLPHVDGAPA